MYLFLICKIILFFFFFLSFCLVLGAVSGKLVGRCCLQGTNTVYWSIHEVRQKKKTITCLKGKASQLNAI